MNQKRHKINANELAEELESISWLQGDGKVKPFQHYADFIRQQQAEIDEFKKEVEWCKHQWNRDRMNLLSQLKTLNRDYRFMKDLAIGTEKLLKKANEK